MNAVEPIRDKKKIDAIKKYLLGSGKEKRFPINESVQNTLEKLLVRQVDLLSGQPIFVSRNGNLKPISRFTAWGTIKKAGKP